MQLVFVAKRYWPAVGGVESYVREICRALARRHDVTVLTMGVDSTSSGRLGESLTPPAPFDSFDDGGVQVRSAQPTRRQRLALSPLVWETTPGLRRYAYGVPRMGSSAWYATVMGPALARRAPAAELIHSWAGDHLGGGAVAAARRLGVPAAITPFVHSGQWGDDPASSAIYRRADAVVALLNTEARTYLDLGVSERRIHVSGACSPGVAPGGGSALRDARRLNGPLVLFLGVRRAYKGFHELLEAARLLASRDITFAFVGPGDPLPWTSSRVLDVGRVDDDERAAWLDAADLLCLPSSGEILPVSILEAWSVGTPVLVSDIPTLQELVSRSGGGVSTQRDAEDLAAAIVQLLASPQRLETLGRAGHDAWSTHYTVDAVATWHERLYEDLLER